MADLPKKQAAARRVGRLIGILAFAAIVTAFTAVCSVEIILQAWAEPEAKAAKAPPDLRAPKVPERTETPESR